MRSSILAAMLVAIATPSFALEPPRTMRELPADWLEDADLSAADQESDRTTGHEDDDQIAGGVQGARQADLAECKPADGTTGAILGAVAGGVLGNVIDGGGHRAFGTLVGAGGGALLGRHIEQNRSACR